MKRIRLTRDRSGRSGRRRGSQNPGTAGVLATGAGAGGGGVCAAAGTSDAIASAMAPATRRAKRALDDDGGCIASEVPAQVVSGGFRAAAEAEGRNKMTILVHQVDDGGVVHRVVVARGRYLLVIDPVGFGDRRDRGGLTGDPVQVRIEAREIILELV